LIGALLVLGGLAAWHLQAVSNARAETVVRHALGVAGKIPYQGTKVTEFPFNGKLMKSEALVARRSPSMRRIHYVTPPLDGVTIWQDARQTFRYDPRLNQLKIYDQGGSPDDAAVEERALVLSNYEPRLEGEESVAGRPAYRVRLAPRHPGDPSRRLWLDKATYLKLGQEDYDGQGRLFRRTRFTEIDFDPIEPDAFHPPQSILASAKKTYSDEELPKSVEHVSSVLGFRIKLPSYVPEGYRLEGAYTYPCQCGCEQPAAQVRWSNGLNTISLFQCGHPCGQEAPCSFPRTAQSASVPISLGEESFLFVGETDRGNLEKMARSLKAAASQIQ
jgi:outer membrane lipoprotein-sorting protein